MIVKATIQIELSPRRGYIDEGGVERVVVCHYSNRPTDATEFLRAVKKISLLRNWAMDPTTWTSYRKLSLADAKIQKWQAVVEKFLNGHLI